MAQHGGYRDPGPVSGPSGPGKLSKRTDGMKKYRKDQAVRTPPLAGSPGMQSGDVGMLQAAQKVQPLPNAQSQDIPQGPQQGQGAAAPQGNIPPFLFNQGSNRPAEPLTAGLAQGPGPGPEVLNAPPTAPDIREQVLQFVVARFGNADAAGMLQNMRMQRAQQTQQPGVPQGPPPAA